MIVLEVEWVYCVKCVAIERRENIMEFLVAMDVVDFSNVPFAGEKTL